MEDKEKMISEQEFIAHCDESLRRLAREVRGCGMTVYEIARRARLSWRTVKRVADGIPVRYDTAERIRLVMYSGRRGGAAIGE